MKKLEYIAPALEVINIEIEGVMAWSTGIMGDVATDDNAPQSPSSNSVGSYLNDYGRK